MSFIESVLVPFDTYLADLFESILVTIMKIKGYNLQKSSPSSQQSVKFSLGLINKNLSERCVAQPTIVAKCCLN